MRVCVCVCVYQYRGRQFKLDYRPRVITETQRLDAVSAILTCSLSYACPRLFFFVMLFNYRRTIESGQHNLPSGMRASPCIIITT